MSYTYLKEIVLHRANYKEYKISKADFKNLHPSDFNDLYLLNLQGKLNHLSGADKVHLSIAVNLWTRNIVIRQRVKDLQLGIESYQTKLNLTQPRWDATDFLFKEDYTIVHKPRAIIYKDRNNQKKMMRETEVHKFSDGTLTRILEKLDFIVKDYELFKFNPGIENRIWTKDDKRRSKLNHLSGADKVHLSIAVNLWTRNIVIRQRVKDLQLGIESYQTKLNLTQPRWDATDFLFKEDYTIVHKPRAIIYKDRNNQKKMMRETEVHKFSDGTLTRILEKLDFIVKDYELFKFNPGIENRIWTKDDKRRSQEFIKLIEIRLKIKRIFKSLESFVSGRLRDVDYRLIQRTE
nr:hypothetical protein [Tanacetum cinerariifolium]